MDSSSEPVPTLNQRQLSMNKTLKFYRPADLAEELSVSTVTIWRMEKRGELPPRKQLTKGVVGWFGSDLQEWQTNIPVAESALRNLSE